MFRGGPRLDGVYAASGAPSLSGVRFTLRTDGPIRSSPAVAGGLLFFGSDDGFLHAVDARSGAERWRFATGGAIRSSPAVENGSVYIASRDGRLYALAAATGRLRWKLAFGADLGRQNYWDFYLSSPIPANGLVYAGSGDGHLYAVDRASGHVVWKHDAASRIR